MSQSYKQLADQALDFWLARGAVLVIVILQIAIVNDLMVGPRWLAPAIELALLIPLSIATVWTQRRARKASTAEQWNLVGRQRLIMRRLALSLTAVVTLMNFGALARLIFAILGGGGRVVRTCELRQQRPLIVGQQWANGSLVEGEQLRGQWLQAGARIWVVEIEAVGLQRDRFVCEFFAALAQRNSV